MSEKRVMKRLGLLGLLGLLGGLALMMAGCGLGAGQGENGPVVREMDVSGEAVVYVTPDRAVLRIGVETGGKDLERARAENNGKVEGIFAVVERHGIEERDVQTSRLTIDKRYSSYGQGREFLGYEVRNRLDVTVHDLEAVEDVMADLFKAGVNEFRGIDFETSDLLKHRREARRMAVRAARQKAEDMAGELDVRVGPPLSVVEEGDRSPGVLRSQNVMMEAADAGSEGSGRMIASGQIPVRARVSAVFELVE